MSSDKIENGIYTKVQGDAKYELSDAWVAAQLWIITEIDNSDVYFIQNLNSRTYLTIKGDSSTGGTPIVGHQRTGTGGQRWKFRRTANRMSYVYGTETSYGVGLNSDSIGDHRSVVSE
ncbi:hypothetical protein BC629DRAFT_1439153 [Irpex lacteus]|nr:hypothetical protein BC629DRAFT_1439153 [Irpex lacteus]